MLATFSFWLTSRHRLPNNKSMPLFVMVMNSNGGMLLRFLSVAILLICISQWSNSKMILCSRWLFMTVLVHLSVMMRSLVKDLSARMIASSSSWWIVISFLMQTLIQWNHGNPLFLDYSLCFFMGWNCSILSDIQLLGWHSKRSKESITGG